jgi:hypothetical protein
VRGHTNPLQQLVNTENLIFKNYTVVYYTKCFKKSGVFKNLHHYLFYSHCHQNVCFLKLKIVFENELYKSSFYGKELTS